MTKSIDYTLETTYPAAMPGDRVDELNGPNVRVVFRPGYNKRFWVQVWRGEELRHSYSFFLLSEAVADANQRIADLGDEMRRAPSNKRTAQALNDSGVFAPFTCIGKD